MPKHLRLFEAFGVELEYMIVDSDTLAIRPITDQLIYAKTGKYLGDVELGRIGWSNELVNHVIEIKCNGPSPTIAELSPFFKEHVHELNQLLSQFGAKLLPTAAHPFMNPEKEMVLWPHDSREIYEVYDRIFNCKGHGWSNLQSVHLNLPFANDAEFEKLHAAVRLVLPLLPALCASSPIIEGMKTPFHDSRLEYYRHNQKRIPAIAGNIIPERAFSEEEYERMVFQPIQEGISPFDQDSVLNKYFLNSRGAIARFDRRAIEIRLMDIQECPDADLAILEAVVYVIEKLVSGRWASLQEQKAWGEKPLKKILLETIANGENTLIRDDKFLTLFKFQSPTPSAGSLWKHLLSDFTGHFPRVLEAILQEGTLSSRIVKTFGEVAPNKKVDDKVLLQTYGKLATCLDENCLLLPS